MNEIKEKRIACDEAASITVETHFLFPDQRFAFTFGWVRERKKIVLIHGYLFFFFSLFLLSGRIISVIFPVLCGNGQIISREKT